MYCTHANVATLKQMLQYYHFRMGWIHMGEIERWATTGAWTHSFWFDWNQIFGVCVLLMHKSFHLQYFIVDLGVIRYSYIIQNGPSIRRRTFKLYTYTSICSLKFLEFGVSVAI